MRDEKGRFVKGNIPWIKGKNSWNKGKKLSEEHKQKVISKLNPYKKGNIPWIKGKHHSKETKIKISSKNKGQIPWWIKKNMPHPLKNLETKEKMIKNKKGKHCSPKTEFQKGNVPWIKNLTKETDERVKKLGEHVSKSCKGRIPWNNNMILNNHYRTIFIRNLGNYTKSEFLKKIWENDDFARRMFNGLKVKPSKPEKILTEFFNLNFTNEWKYVGDGYTWIAGKCPDWLNVNGKKLLIEFNGFYTHTKEEEIEREKHFLKYGFKTLFLHYDDFKLLKKEPEKVIEKIRKFMEDENEKINPSGGNLDGISIS